LVDDAIGYHRVAIGDSDVEWSQAMLIVGLILLLLGIFLNVGILTTIGIILLVVGAILWILGAVGRPIAGRRYWY
jgi:hypothetical protein